MIFPTGKNPSGTDNCVTLSAEIEIHKVRDAGLYQSLFMQLSIEDQPESLSLRVTVTHAADKTANNVKVSFGGKGFEGLEAQDALGRIQSAKSVVFHNSTQTLPRMFFRGGMAMGVFRELSAENEQLLAMAKKTVNNALTKTKEDRRNSRNSWQPVRLGNPSNLACQK